jgi:hypothetical protein
MQYAVMETSRDCRINPEMICGEIMYAIDSAAGNPIGRYAVGIPFTV